MGEMNPDLMGAASFQPGLDEAVGAKSLQQTIVGLRGLAAITHRHLETVAGVATDGRINRSTAGQLALAHRQIASLDCTILEPLHEPMVGGQRSRYDQQPTRVLVEPMNDTGAGHGYEVGIQVKQRILQSTPSVAGTGVNYQPRRFVYDKKGGILMDHSKRYRLRDGRHFFDQLRVELQFVGGRHGRLPRPGPTVDGQRPALNPALDAASGKIGPKRGRRLVQAPPGEILWYGDGPRDFQPAILACPDSSVNP